MGKLAVRLDYRLEDLRGSNFSRVKTFLSSPEHLDGLQFPLSLLFKVGAEFLLWEYCGQGVKMTTLSIQCQGEE
jgi:phage-related protein